MHYYKRNIGDYAKKAGRLTMLQHGAYTLLLDSVYDREKFPTLDEAIEWTWASTREEVEAVEFVLRKFFSRQEDGRFTQTRIIEELDKYHANSETNKRIALEREAKRKSKSTKREHSVDEAPPNQEPLTNNQEPVTKNQSLAGTDVPTSPAGAEPAKFPGCDHKAVVGLYHEILPFCPRVEVWNELRAGYLRSRWREVCVDLAKSGPVTKDAILGWWRDFFGHVATSPFLTGKIASKERPAFLADMEWLIRPGNFAKIIEGRYHRS